jgi:XTP/dITP diphosphohydrolase
MAKRKLYFITGNKSKFDEAQLVINNPNIKLLQKDLKLHEIQSLDQEKVVINKAEQAFSVLNKPVLVDDTGIYFEEYDNFPGTNSKVIFRTVGFKGVERLLNGTNKNAYFKTLMCYKDKDKTIVFSGIWKGRITDRISKMFNPEWQYSSIFIPEGYSVPLSEIPSEERARVSHRKKAFDEFKSYMGGQE